MDPKQSELIGLVRALVDSLEAAQLSYAVGGAIALAAWSEPRATKDVDVTAFISEDRVGDGLFDALAAAGLAVDREQVEVREMDTSFVRATLVEVVGEDDERIARWDEMVAVSD